MVLMQGQYASNVVSEFKRFLASMEEQRFEEIWNSMMTHQARDLVSHTTLPLHFLETGDLDQLLDFDIISGMAIGFQMNHDGQRTAYFQGIAQAFIANHWYNLDHSDSTVFAIDDAAIVINASQDRPLVLPFLMLPTGKYVADWEAFLVFSMTLSSSKLFEVGTRALVYDEPETAHLYFRYSAQLAAPLDRLDHLVVNQALVKRYIDDARKEELKAQKAHSQRAIEQLRAGMRPSEYIASSFDMVGFLNQHFRNYESSAGVALTDPERQRLDSMSDAELRKAVAEILTGVDLHQARREAQKAHGPAEMADMVVDVNYRNRIYSLCMPFKTGIEMRSQKSVPERVVYQVWRPHMFLTNAVVVFVTARPCSQFLNQDIRQSRDRMGWPIAVIEHDALARLLKANGRL